MVQNMIVMIADERGNDTAPSRTLLPMNTMVDTISDAIKVKNTPGKQ